MTRPAIDPVVSFLSRPESHANGTHHVAVIETHLSWVFLTATQCYKLKKAVRQDGLDLRTPEARRANAAEEVRLNRRLAPSVYLGVVAVTREAGGGLRIGDAGTPIDWLVHMRPLQADRALDAVIRSGQSDAQEPAIRAVATHLAHFYQRARPEPLSAAAHRTLLGKGVRRDARTLLRSRYGLPRDKVDALARAQLTFLDRAARLFERRVIADRLVDGHGDLRPEHIWLAPEPAIIDCLEFDKSLRLLDPADELAFLGLECDRLGAPMVGGWFLETYSQVTGDVPPAALLEFYRVYRALRRANIAARHLDDPHVRDPDRFVSQAQAYLAMVEPVAVAPDLESR